MKMSPSGLFDALVGALVWAMSGYPQGVWETRAVRETAAMFYSTVGYLA
jgi:hypothetical protein|tara:strand:- start:4116 stop:4262 length:147 start_codon:yes stop_codon:yes gene_type:complete